MTSLIDVIFLLLLFFMLTSTFTKYGEIELTSGGQGTGGDSQADRLFLTMRPSGLLLNGTPVAMDELRDRLDAPEGSDPRMLLISLGDATTSHVGVLQS